MDKKFCQEKNEGRRALKQTTFHTKVSNHTDGITLKKNEDFFKY